eukprot:UN09322
MLVVCSLTARNGCMSNEVFKSSLKTAQKKAAFVTCEKLFASKSFKLSQNQRFSKNCMLEKFISDT